MPNWSIQEITPDDQAFLFDMLYEAVYVDPGTPKPGREVLELPEISKYVKNWGQNGDFGLLALDEAGKKAGAVWLRYFPSSNKGYGFVSEDIPELSIAVSEAHRGMGLGTVLMKKILKQTIETTPSISLSVHENNPAIRLYSRLGFYRCGILDDSIVMRIDRNKQING